MKTKAFSAVMSRKEEWWLRCKWLVPIGGCREHRLPYTQLDTLYSREKIFFKIFIRQPRSRSDGPKS